MYMYMYIYIYMYMSTTQRTVQRAVSIVVNRDCVKTFMLFIYSKYKNTTDYVCMCVCVYVHYRSVAHCDWLWLSDHVVDEGVGGCQRRPRCDSGGEATPPL